MVLVGYGVLIHVHVYNVLHMQGQFFIVQFLYMCFWLITICMPENHLFLEPSNCIHVCVTLI